MPDAEFKSTGDINPENRIPDLQWYYPEQHPEGSPEHSSTGGLAIDAYGQTVGLKAASYRLPDDRKLPGKYRGAGGDLFHIEGLSRTDEQRGRLPLAGIEMEILAFDEHTGEPFALRDREGKAVNQRLEDLIGSHPELWAHTAEIETAEPRPTSAEAITELKTAVFQLFSALPEGVQLDPISAWMDREPTNADTTPNPYVDVMIEALGENIMNFVGHGIHEHYDVDPEDILFVAQYLQMLAPYLNAGLQSAPFIHGDLEPKLSEVFDTHPEVDLLKEVEKASTSPGYASVRYATRYFGSSAGGVRPNAHASRDEFMKLADRKLRDGIVNNVARADGPHGDIRQRFDLPPGRVELCVKDDPMGNMAVLKAYMDLTWNVINTLIEVSRLGDEGRSNLHTAFADLFGDKEDPSEMTAVYERIHRNSLVISKDGPYTTVQDSKGNDVGVRHQVERVMDFVRSYNNAVPESSIQVIRATLGDPRRIMIGSTANEYYATNFATPSDYIRLAVTSYMESGMSQEAAIQQAKLDRMQQFSAYILQTS